MPLAASEDAEDISLYSFIMIIYIEKYLTFLKDLNLLYQFRINTM